MTPHTARATESRVVFTSLDLVPIAAVDLGDGKHGGGDGHGLDAAADWNRASSGEPAAGNK